MGGALLRRVFMCVCVCLDVADETLERWGGARRARRRDCVVLPPHHHQLLSVRLLGLTEALPAPLAADHVVTPRPSVRPPHLPTHLLPSPARAAEVLVMSVSVALSSHSPKTRTEMFWFHLSSGRAGYSVIHNIDWPRGTLPLPPPTTATTATCQSSGGCTIYALTSDYSVELI